MPGNKLTPELCEEKHKVIDRRLDEGRTHFEKLEEKIEKFLWVMISGMGAILLAVLATFLTIWTDSKKNDVSSGPRVAHHEAAARTPSAE